MTSISKNVYIDKLDNIGNKYSNTYHRTIKMKPVGVKLSTYIDSSEEISDKDRKFKIGNILRISNIKTFLKKSLFEIGLKNFLRLKKLKTLFRGHVISDLKGEEIVGMFYEKELKKKNESKGV